MPRTGAPVQAIVVAGRFHESIHGRSAVDRHLHHLRALGLHAVVRDVAAGGRFGIELADDVLWIDGDTVFDPRLYRAAWEADGPVRLVESGGAPIGLTRLSGPAAYARLGGDAAAPVPDGGGDLDVSTLDPYLPAMRRRVPPYWVRLAETDDRRRAERLVLDSAQKGALDFPARFLHPWLENALATALAGRRVTPNQVTVVSAAIGFAAAALFAQGRYLPGFVLAIVANVLDGVDGKLARITLRQSQGGDYLDHALDIGFEFSWYLALGWALGGGSPRAPAFGIGVAILSTMVACRLASGSYGWVTGRSIHDHRGFDRAFRLVAGRRNIYVLLLLAGHLGGRLADTFDLVLAYAVVTLGVYVTRNLVALSWRPR